MNDNRICTFGSRAVSSVGLERYFDRVEVTGSIPVQPTVGKHTPISEELACPRGPELKRVKKQSNEKPAGYAIFLRRKYLFIRAVVNLNSTRGCFAPASNDFS